jgi:hypothetical protein
MTQNLCFTDLDSEPGQGTSAAGNGGGVKGARNCGWGALTA